MSDIEIESTLVDFVEQTRNSGELWALTAEEGGFVVLDSNQFEDTDVLLLWQSEALAQAQCKEEWQIYTPVLLEVSEFIDHWADELHEDSALVGLNWNDDQVCVEIEPKGLANALAE